MTLWVTPGVADIFGAIGGAVLAACLLPQLWKLMRTKSAQDISMAFLIIYFFAMLFTFLYLLWMDALVAWICVLIELVCVALMIAVKIYFDRWGPNSKRLRARPEARLTTSQSFAAEVNIDVRGARGAGGAQLLRPAATHVAQHLLLDARLELPAGWREAEPAEPTPKEGSEPSGRGSGGAAGGQGAVLRAVGEMAEAALEAAGLPVRSRQSQAFPSFRRPGGDAEAAATPAAPDMLYMACRDGYVAAVWHPASSTLSLDLLAASDAAVGRMAEAAAALCEQLATEWPGSRVEASSVARLPRVQQQQQQQQRGQQQHEDGKEVELNGTAIKEE